MGRTYNSSRLTIDARLPDFRPMAPASGKSRQLWITRLNGLSGTERKRDRQVGYKSSYAQRQTRARS